ncbi:bifunctional alpha/beta hydrolase/OsmC family protein [Novosphingobium sp. KN65.2]|uniref:bifunctional alpha/beta hydrolase/OsmC family protein n=1 Tax=Novosphingobium sp. KN65.2 TaxID=1478134 RepID=UPI0005DF36CE|nr:bifunctional alpha/beta hydrolase/OsmC family protein [Novosphingobium sp. KN65.2]CDO37396.1 conserved hypothetical protein; putative hydrolase [Novosphingobium sp. KN65.2]
MAARAFDFTGANGHRLSGRLDVPEGRARAWAIFAHCFTCGKDNLAAVRVGRALAAQGIGVLRFDFAGLGASEGDFAASKFSADVADLIAAAEVMTGEGMAPSLLIGHSMGGAAAIAAAGEIASVRAVATIGAPFSLQVAMHHFGDEALSALERDGEADVHLAGRPFRVGKAMVEELRATDLGAALKALRKPLLIMHAPLDDTVPLAQATRIFTAALHPKSFVTLDDADHLLTRKGDADYVAGIVMAWAARYLDLPQAVPAPRPSEDVLAEETGAGKFQLAISAGGARFLADEPRNVGGLGSGPSPYDLLSSALAACTTMTLRLYADHKGLPVTRIRTAVGHRRETGQAQPDVFTRRIAIEGEIDADQRQRLLEMAERCPVHRTLEKGARFDTVIGEPPAAAEPESAHAADMQVAVDARD